MKIKNIILLAALSLSLASCSDLFEPAEENNRGVEAMLKEPTFAQGLLGYAYSHLPYSNSSVTDIATDDAVTNDLASTYSKMAQGAWAANNDPMSQWNGRRSVIQYLNQFLAIADNVKWADDPIAAKVFAESRKGEAYALRALNLYYLVQAHAGWSEDGELLGVPLSTTVEDANTDFNQSRATFQQCIDQINSDLDEAIKLLPLDYKQHSESEVPAYYKELGASLSVYDRVFGEHLAGRISGRIAEAIRAQVALMASSEAYKGGCDVTVANAADAAATVLDRIGGVSGMAANGNTWYTNKDEIKKLKSGAVPAEIIWRSNVNEGKEDYDLGVIQEKNNFPPTLYGKGRINPTQNLVDAFPMANGYPITDEENSEFDDIDPYSNRDPRLDLYIIHNGSEYKGKTINTTATGETNDGLNKISTSTRTGYYLKKLLRDDCSADPNNLNTQPHYNAYIRYTEIFLDYAEAANEAWGPKGKGTHNYSAYDVIKAIRQRAGITDTGYLDECAEDQAKMRELIHNERRIELCFENHRFWDLRRWKANIAETAKGVNVTEVDGIPTFEEIDVETRNYSDYMYYGPIPQSETLKWSNLKQNKGWNVKNND